MGVTSLCIGHPVSEPAPQQASIHIVHTDFSAQIGHGSVRNYLMHLYCRPLIVWWDLHVTNGFENFLYPDLCMQICVDSIARAI